MVALSVVVVEGGFTKETLKWLGINNTMDRMPRGWVKLLYGKKIFKPDYENAVKGKDWKAPRFESRESYLEYKFNQRPFLT